MKRLLLFSIALLLSAVTFGQIQMTGTAGATLDGTYTSFTNASGVFVTLNGSTQTGATIIITINGDVTTETGTNGLNAGAWTSITINPSGARTISGAATAGNPLINLNGADYVTFNGLNTSGNSLVISNTTNSATAGTSTIRFINGAISNTITNCTVLGSFSGSATTNGGNIFFSTDGTTTNGNDNNTISYCNIGPAGSNLSTKGIFMNGTTTSSGYFNSGNLITYNNIYDYFGPAVASAGIYISTGNTDNNITNNKFYQTATRTQTTGAQHSAIWISASSGNNFQITGNTIGFASSAGTGIYTFVGVSSSSALVPIFLSVGTTTATSVQGNTIAGISMSGAVSGTSSSAAFRGIYVSGGLTTVGDVTGNTIGSMSSTGSITFSSSSSSSADVVGMFNFGSSVWTTNNNNIGGITAGNTSTGAANIFGIRCFTGSSYSWTCNNNTVGGNIANSISSSSTATGTVVVGILNSASPSTIQGNIVRNLSAAGGTGTGTSASVVGIHGSAASSANHTISSNQIYNLNNTSASSAVTVSGIIFGGSTGTNLVAKNFIHSLSVISSNASSTINGISVNSGTATYQNNMIRVGIDGSGNSLTAGIIINGINETIAGTDNFYFNSVYVGGSSVTGSANTYAFNSSITTNTRSYRDNIFMNARSNGTGTGKHYAVKVGGTAPNPGGLTINYNDYYVSGTGGVFGYFNSLDVANLGAWKTAVGQDAASWDMNPQYQTPNGTASTVDLHINPGIATPIEGKGVNIATVTDDYDSQARASYTPEDIGADALNATSLPTCTGQPAASTIVGPSLVCYNTGTTLSLSVAYTDIGLSFQWKSTTTSGSGYSNLGTSSTQATGPLTVTTYYICTITCSYSGLSFTTPEVGIGINPLPTVTLNPLSGVMCTPSGSGVSITASGANTYSWAPTTGLNPTTGPTVIATPATTTTYTVTGTDLNGCIDTAMITVRVNPSVYVNSVTAVPAIICPGGSTTVTAIAGTTADYVMLPATFGLLTATGPTTTLPTGDDALLATVTLPFTFSFYGSGYSSLYIYSNGYVAFSSGVTSSPYVATIPTAAAPNNFIAISHDDLNVTVSGQMKYFTNGTTPNRIFVIDYNNVRYYNTGSNNGDLTGQIRLYEADGHIEIQVQNSVDPTLSAKSLGIENSDGTKGYSPATRNNLAYDITTSEAWKFIPSGGTLQYTWSESPLTGTLVSTTGNPVSATNIASSNTYTVVVTETTTGCSAFGSGTVNTGAPLSAGVTSPLRCTAEITTPITATATGGTPPYHYTWTPINALYVDAAGTDDYDGAALDAPTIYTKVYTPTYDYLVTITDNCGTTATAVSTVTVHQTPTASASSNSPVCTGHTLELHGTTDLGTTYLWTGPNGFSSFDQNPTITNVTLNAAGTYYFTATAGGCQSATASVTVVIYLSPTALAVVPSNVLQCPGAIQQLDITGGFMSNSELLSENFNGSVPGWTVRNNSTGGSDPDAAAWSLYLPSPSFKSNDSTIFVMSNSDAQGSGGHTNTLLMTPVMNTIGYTSLNLSFWHFFNWWSVSDTIRVEVSTDGGLTWNINPIYEHDGSDIGSATVFAHQFIDLTPYTDVEELQLRFHFVSVWGYYWAIDNVLIAGDKTAAITWSPYDDLYSDAGAITPYAGEDMPTVYSKVYTVRTYTATATTSEGCTSSGSATITGVDYTVSGSLKYNNNPKTPMPLADLILNPGGYTVTTDEGGNYAFNHICDGNYTISLVDANHQPGGINSTDAVQMNVWNANQVAIPHVKFLAGEVDYDVNNTINATDALAVQNYFVFHTPFDRTLVTGLPWVMWKAGDIVLNNADPNRLLTDIPVTVAGSNVTFNLYGQAIGDFSGSYVPYYPVKGGSTSVELLTNDTRIAGSGAELDLPVRMMNASYVSAVSLILNFPSELARVTGVSMNGLDIQPVWSVAGDELRIGWNTTNPLWLGANEELLTISIVTTEKFGAGSQIRFTLASDPLNELADATFEVISNAVLGMQGVEFSAYGIIDPTDGNSVSLQSRPNPFADYTMISYSIPADGRVTLKITDMLGREVTTLVNEFKTSGNYSCKLDAEVLQPGVYTATITLDKGTGDVMKTIKLIRK